MTEEICGDMKRKPELKRESLDIWNFLGMKLDIMHSGLKSDKKSNSGKPISNLRSDEQNFDFSLWSS